MAPSNAIFVRLVAAINKFEFSCVRLHGMSRVIVPRCGQMSTMLDNSERCMLIDKSLHGVVVAVKGACTDELKSSQKPSKSKARH